MVKREVIGLAEEQLAWEATLLNNVTKFFLLLGPPSPGVFVLRPMTLINARFSYRAGLILSPPQSAMVLAVESMLRPLLLGGVMIANRGALVRAFTSSLTLSFSGKAWLVDNGIPSKLYVENEPVYKARAWDSMRKLERGKMRSFGVCVVIRRGR